MLIKLKIKGLKIDSDFQPFNSCVKNILIMFYEYPLCYLK